MINLAEDKLVLKELFREVLNEVIREERISFYNSIIPSVSKTEMKEIEESYGEPSLYRNEDFSDLTDWVKS